MLIALTGKMGRGKTTLADYLVEKYGFIKLSVATPLKKIAEKIGMKGKDRALLQRLGTAILEEDEDFFIRYLIKQILELSLKCKDRLDVVIDDVRYENEINQLRNVGYDPIVVALISDENKVLKRFGKMGIFPTRGELGHKSETEFQKIKSHYILREFNNINDKKNAIGEIVESMYWR